MSGLNHKRFEQLDVSDDDWSDEEPENEPSTNDFSTGNFPPGFGQLSRPTGKPAFVKLQPGDDGAGLGATFFKDPRTFEPHRCPEDNRSEFWGLCEYEPVENEWYPAACGMEWMMRRMQVQTLYFNATSPEDQFVQVLFG